MNDLRPHEKTADLNTVLANRAVEWDARAEEAEARGRHEEAELHYERARHAYRGRLLVDPADMDWQLKNHSLHARCAAEGRIAYPEGTVRVP